MKILIPQGIGDCVWALHKVQDVAKKKGDGRIEIFIACADPSNHIESRALEFVRRFKFVEKAEMKWIPTHDRVGATLLPGNPADENGYYRYISDGEGVVDGIDYTLMPNAALERGIRLEDWLPEFEINWNIMDDFQFTTEEEARGKLHKRDGEYVAFFPGSESSNTWGHNRGGIWQPSDWIELGRRIQETLGVRILVVGAEYDRDYYDKFLKNHVNWDDHIGRWGIGDTYAILKNARFVISYQSGIGIVSNYLGVPVAIFWRAKGDSINPHFYLSFEEGMASAWARPDMIESGKHLPLIYGRHDVNYIIDEIQKRKW